VRRSHRSVSPSKIASPKKTAGVARQRKSNKKVEKTEKIDDGELSEASTKLSSKDVQEATKEAVSEDAAQLDELKEEEPVVRVNVTTDTEVKGDVEVTHTHVEVEMPAGSPQLPLPEDTAAMIAKAKEMVEAAREANDTAPNSLRKRKVEEVDEADTEESAVVEAPAKKAKVETELKKERVKTRALIGISATLAIG
jgi:hypothetical protein